MKKSSLSFVIILLYPCILLSQAPPSLPPDFFSQAIATGKDFVSMAFSPDGRLFVTEKHGSIYVVENDVMNDTPILTIPVESISERGLLGIAIDPDFEFNKYIYIYYSVFNENFNRISRFPLHDSHLHLEDEEILLELPLLPSFIHNGGDLKFGPDGKLYAAIGDGYIPWLAQSHSSLFGKILRLNPDGSIPTDNPFYLTNNGVYKAIYAYGFRNPFTMSFSPEGQLFVNDVGQASYEEVNMVNAGKNYGWSFIEGPIPEGLTPPSNYEEPIYTYSHEVGCAVTGSAYYPVQMVAFPEEYRGKYYFGDLCNGTIQMLDLQTRVATPFIENGTDPIAICIGPEGDFYYISFVSGPGILWKVSYSTDGNPKITAQPKVNTLQVGESAELTVTAIGKAELRYQWMKDGTPIPDALTSSISLQNLTMADSGSVYVCEISNDYGSVNTNPLVIKVTDRSRPEVLLEILKDPLVYRAGDTISAKGSALDQVEGLLDNSALKWQVNFHHDFHSHPVISETTGSDSIAVVVPRIGETSTNVWFRISLQGTNDVGLTQSVYQDVHPQLSTFSIDPILEDTGITAIIDGSPVQLPISVASVSGMTRTIDFPVVQYANDHAYVFESWNDSIVEKSITFDVSEPPLVFTPNLKKIYLGAGTGLTGNYYSKSATFKDVPDLTRIDMNIDFSWGSFAPANEISADKFCIKWEGYISIPDDGLYNFKASVEDSISVVIEGEQIMNVQPNSQYNYVGEKQLAAGVYPIQIDFFEKTDRASVNLYWNSEQIPLSIIPPNVFHNTSHIYRPQMVFMKEVDRWQPEGSIDFEIGFPGSTTPVPDENITWTADYLSPQDSIRLSSSVIGKSFNLQLPGSLDLGRGSHLKVTVSVEDDFGYTEKLQKVLFPTNADLSPLITFTNETTSFDSNEEVVFEAYATDYLGSAIRSDNFEWSVRLVDGEIEREIYSSSGNLMSFIFPDTLGDLSNLSLRCYLTVTNELSAPETVTKICHPKLYSVEIRSNVQAATIFVDDNEVTLPAMLEAPRNSGFEVNPVFLLNDTLYYLGSENIPTKFIVSKDTVLDLNYESTALDDGGGLKGYYTSKDGHVNLRIDEQIDFVFTQDDNLRTVRWLGSVKPPMSGEYTIVPESNTTAQIKIDDILFLLTDKRTVSENHPISLDKNEYYRIEIDLGEFADTTEFRLQWYSETLPLHTIPKNQLYESIVSSLEDYASPLVSVYPNPVTRQLIILIPPHGRPSKYKAVLYDIHGRAAAEQISSDASEKMEMSVSHLSEGVYILEVSDIYHSVRMKVFKL